MTPSPLPQETAMPQQKPERLSFMLGLAAFMHAAIILGIGFAPDAANIKLPSLEVTLSRYQHTEAPKEADYIAQHNQLGSGTQDEKAELSSKSDSDFHDNKTPSEELLKLSRQREQALQHELLSAHRRSPESRSNTASIRNIVQAQQLQGDDQTTELSSNISSLEAQLKDLNQSYARMPRPKFITSVATRGSPDAVYLDRWEDRVEAIGNANYPAEARRNNIEGELRLLLMLMPNGAVDEVRILKSSGHDILDRAALQIVRKAAPYEAIPADVLDGKNRLGIVRTWRFEQQSLSASNH